MALVDKIALLATRVATQFKSIAPRLMPAGGSAGAFLQKAAASDYSVGWTTIAAWIATSSPGMSGFWKLSDSVILQWGPIPSGGTDVAVSFKTPFPNGCWGVVPSALTSQTNGSLAESIAYKDVTKNGFTPVIRYALNGSTGPDGAAGFYFAIGN